MAYWLFGILCGEDRSEKVKPRKTIQVPQNLIDRAVYSSDESECRNDDDSDSPYSNNGGSRL